MNLNINFLHNRPINKRKKHVSMGKNRTNKLMFKMAVFWDVVPRSLVDIDRYLPGLKSLQLHVLSSYWLHIFNY
jgi:hypothetical protein